MNEIKLRPMTLHTLRDLVRDLKVEGLHDGQYPTPVNYKEWETRDKSKASLNCAYRSAVRRINALEEVISILEKMEL